MIGAADTGITATPTSDSAAAANGKRSSERLPAHALPLFDLSGLPGRLTDDVPDSASDSAAATNGNGKRKTDRYLGHSLPLFGQDSLSHRPLTVGANGHGHSDGNGHSEQSAENDLGNALPLFGGNVLSHQATNGNGKHRAT